MDLILGTSFLNLAPQRLNPMQSEEWNKQVEDLLSRGSIRESLSPCVLPTIITLKKDGGWRMCMDEEPSTKLPSTIGFHCLEWLISCIV
jgi:hypothetical protein